MRICIPVHKDLGLGSEVHDHFGEAPLMLFIDTDEGSMLSVPNKDLDHVEGNCNPLKALGGRPVEHIIAGGIGEGPLIKLRAAGIRVFKAEGRTVEENITIFFDHGLPEFVPHDRGQT